MISTALQPRTIHTHRLSNQMVLVGEPTQSVQSAAFTLLIPSGSSSDPNDRQGLSSMLCDMVLRGAGARDGRSLINDLEILGVERGEAVGASQTSFSAATLSENLHDTLEIYADIVRNPVLPEDQLEFARQVCIQEIRSAEDEPAQKLMNSLRKRAYPDPWGRSSCGTLQGISDCSYKDIQQQWSACYRPNDTILGVAGNFRWSQLIEHAEKLFGDWPSKTKQPSEKNRPFIAPAHDTHDSNQCHLGIAFPTVPYRHEDYLQAWAAVGVLSSGMSSRLFTEVREKRGLCYTVSATLQTHLDQARVFCYAGTTSDRAQETLDVTYGELLRLGDGIDQSELDRLQAQIKSGLIMQQESSNARSASLARDWYHLGRARTLDEIGHLVDLLSSDTINHFLTQNPPSNFTFATLGPQPLELPLEV